MAWHQGYGWAAFAVPTCLSVSGCDRLLTTYVADTVPAPNGTEQVNGLQAQVKVSRDTLGIALIEARNEDDLAFAMGYVAAEGRLSQMIGLKMTAAGRLAKMGGKPLPDIDFYLRCINLDKATQLLYAATSPQTRRIFQRYAEGVNAFVASHKLPPDLQLTGFKPHPWRSLSQRRLILASAIIFSSCHIAICNPL
jgi:acyl-homoserine-lactone acylase